MDIRTKAHIWACSEIMVTALICAGALISAITLSWTYIAIFGGIIALKVIGDYFYAAFRGDVGEMLDEVRKQEQEEANGTD